MYNGAKYFILPYMNLIGFQDFADPFQINLPYVRNQPTLDYKPLLNNHIKRQNCKKRKPLK